MFTFVFSPPPLPVMEDMEDETSFSYVETLQEMEDAEEVDYSKFKVAQLKEFLRERGVKPL